MGVPGKGLRHLRAPASLAGCARVADSRMTTMRWIPWLAAVALWAAALPASAVLTIDPTASSLTPTAGSPESLSGTLKVVLGDPLPLASNTTFDLTQLSAQSSGGLDITLDSSLATPGAGVLNPSGGFLFPSLFLELDDGMGSAPLTVLNVTGSYGALPGCPTSLCLETTFQIDTGGPAGIVTVNLLAIPEPGSAWLLAAGLVALRARAAREVVR